ncbi:hypothetical protein DL765_004609 [Monosporascus sp. GIB2]|nr:hypothetical protein DL765_004609 [Monosporascus sp. GIB2]
MQAQMACKVMSLVFPGQVYTPQDPRYQSQSQQNWSQTCWLPSACFVRPRNAVEVAVSLKVITVVGSKFAVRGGGHNPNAGFASVDSSGVNIDLRSLDFLAMKEDGVLQAGPGNTWEKLYAFVEQKGRSVIGGRHGSVGIPGFLLGASTGWLSIMSKAFRIVNANNVEHPDLFRALKGGGSNFGIVTRIDLDTHPLIHAQYTINAYAASDYANILNATIRVQQAMESDDKIGFFLNVYPDVMVAGLLYAEHTPARPSVFNRFFELHSLIGPIVANTNGTVATLVPALDEVGTTALPVSSKVDYDLYIDVHRQFLEILKGQMPTGNLSYTIQALPSYVARVGREKGGNTLGLSDIPQSWWACLIEWFNESETSAAQAQVASLGESIRSLARQRNGLLEYKFMNDAGFAQNVLDSYGAANVNALKDTANKYDIDAVFQNLQNGGFLLEQRDEVPKYRFEDGLGFSQGILRR